MMDGWVDYVHFSFIGEHILFSSLRLNTVWEFFLGVLLTAVICLSERFVSQTLPFTHFKSLEPQDSCHLLLASNGVLISLVVRD